MSSSTPAPTPSPKPASQNPTPSNSRPASRERSSASAAALGTSMDKNPEDKGKLRMFLDILRKFIGVTDLAAVRFSLPPQLMEPIPNLEYWHYLDRPETFASIGDSDDPLGRMLGALRFWFSKDLKYIKGRPCKPYNSTLGEFFRCNWQITETSPPPIGNKPPQPSQPTQAPQASQGPQTSTPPTGTSPPDAPQTSAPPTGTNPPQATETPIPGPSADNPSTVSYLTEQTSHHPPVSAYYIYCPEKGISGRGYDQISAQISKTLSSMWVTPGDNNKGIYVTLHNFEDETYNLTHPTAKLGGILKGSLNITVADTCYVTCPKSRLKAILTYQEEGWLGKTQNRMAGVIFRYDPDNDKTTTIKDVPSADILARVEGCWHEQIYFTLGSKAFEKSNKSLLLDLRPLIPVPKIVPPMELQLPNESQRYWTDVTNAILDKQWNQAKTAKFEIEDRQRAKKEDRDARNVAWKPRFFAGSITPVGKPELSEEGWDAVKRMHDGDWTLKESAEMAA